MNFSPFFSPFFIFLFEFIFPSGLLWVHQTDWLIADLLAGEPINIHVSVTINPGMVGPGGTYSTGTLADLKRNRSQNRLSGSNSSRIVEYEVQVNF